MEQDIRLLRDHAARCRAIADGARTPGLADTLHQLAEKLEREANDFASNQVTDRASDRLRERIAA